MHHEHLAWSDFYISSSPAIPVKIRIAFSGYRIAYPLPLHTFFLTTPESSYNVLPGPTSLCMQLNKTRAGSGACLQLVKASTRGSDYQKKFAYLWKHVIPLFLLVIVLSGSAAQVMAGEPNPKITITKKNSTLQEVFKEIQKQTQYAFVYNNEMMKETKRISIDVKEATIDQVLSIVFRDQPVTYSLVDKIVVIKKKEKDRYPESAIDTSKALPDEVNDVKGIVMDEQSNPLPRVTVTVRNSNNATATDEKGHFSLSNVQKGATLQLTCVGYEPMIVINRRNLIQANLKVSVNKLDETVVVAYNTSTQRTYTGAVTVVKGEQFKNLPNLSFDKSLQGLVPGLVVTNGSGQPGSAPSTFMLRGIATSGSPLNGESFRNPLIVIDGVPVTQDPTTSSSFQIPGVPSGDNPMAQLNPSDIESITVLKDAAAASLYGSKASNGVILVTTRRGKNGKTVVSFRQQTNFSSSLTGKAKILNREQYLELLMEAYKNSDPNYTDELILADLRQKFPHIVNAPGDTSFYPEADWTGALYHKNALATTSELSVTGGNSKSNFYLNLEYTKTNGVLKKTDYDRKSLRFNYENRLTTWFKFGLNSAISYSVQNQNTFENTEVFISPLLPIKDENNKYFYNYSNGMGATTGSLIPNPVAAAELNINENKTYRSINSLTINISPLKFLSFNSVLGFDFMLAEARKKIHPNFAMGSYDPGVGNIAEENNRSANIITTNTLLFTKDLWTDHNLQLLIGQEAQVMTRKFLNANLFGFGNNPSQDQIGSGVGSLLRSTGFNTRNALLSYFSQLNYGIKNKYFLSSSFRKDGASQFGKNKRFGTFWSVGGGWVLSEENFIKNLSSSIDFIKFRGSIGSSGNSTAIVNSARYDPLYMLSYNEQTAVFTRYASSPGNRDIQWESTLNWNIGVDLRLWKNRVSVTADMYTRKTKNLIAYNIKLPLASGYDFFSDNIGDIKNRGIEISVTAFPIRNENFSWTINANWSKNTNRLTKSYYPRSEVFGTMVVNEVGREYNSYYLPIWAGVNPDNGNPMWIDSSTGKPTEDYWAAKKEIVGKAQPDGFGSVINSFSYKGFDFSFNLYYQYGSQIFFGAGVSLINDGAFPYINQIQGAMDRWTPQNKNAANPKRLLGGTGVTQPIPSAGTSASTRYLFDGDFVRLSNVSLAYNFPKHLLASMKLNALKVYVQGNNLATWTKYSGRDPENINAFGSADFLYPIAKTYSIGIQVGL